MNLNFRKPLTLARLAFHRMRHSLLWLMVGPAYALAALLAMPAEAALTVNGSNGTVTDSTTGLVWDQCLYGNSGLDCSGGTPFLGDWAAALNAVVAANAANYKGYNDWRLPNLKELESITKIDAVFPAIDTSAFPHTPSSGDPYRWGGTWTSTSNMADASGARAIRFLDGLSYIAPKTVAHYARLVRSGQPLANFDALASAALPIPTLSEWGMILMVAVLSLAGLRQVRRRQV